VTGGWLSKRLGGARVRMRDVDMGVWRGSVCPQGAARPVHGPGPLLGRPLSAALLRPSAPAHLPSTVPLSVLCSQTKSGEPLRTAVFAEVLEAGKRLVERGSFSFEKVRPGHQGRLQRGGHPVLHPGTVSALRRHLGHREGRGPGFGGGLPQQQQPGYHAAHLRDARRPDESSHPGIGLRERRIRSELGKERGPGTSAVVREIPGPQVSGIRIRTTCCPSPV